MTTSSDSSADTYTAGQAICDLGRVRARIAPFVLPHYDELLDRVQRFLAEQSPPRLRTFADEDWEHVTGERPPVPHLEWVNPR